MFVKKLTVEQFGRIGYKSFLFEQPLTVFAGEETEEIFAALCVVLDNRLLRFQTTRYCFTDKSKFYAEIEKAEKSIRRKRFMMKVRPIIASCEFIAVGDCFQTKNGRLRFKRVLKRKSVRTL